MSPNWVWHEGATWDMDELYPRTVQARRKPDLDVIESAVGFILDLHVERDGYCATCGGNFPCLTRVEAQNAWDELGTSRLVLPRDEGGEA